MDRPPCPRQFFFYGERRVRRTLVPDRRWSRERGRDAVFREGNARRHADPLPA
jgi:hypothetical protein